MQVSFREVEIEWLKKNFYVFCFQLIFIMSNLSNLNSKICITFLYRRITVYADKNKSITELKSDHVACLQKWKYLIIPHSF